jgi:gliding motility-associated-like protein
VEPDGDSLYYSLIAPGTGPATTVTYLAGYSAQQPLISNPGVTFNNANGDICMTPAQQEVTVLAVKVEEWRNGIFIGSVIRDIQLRTVVCNNTVPTLSGINGSGQFTTTGCAGAPINFSIPSFDPDAGQTLSINWNNGIPGGTFTTNGAQHPTGTFSWTPTQGDVSSVPHCFTVTVSDDNCPYYGMQVYSFCVTVSGFTTTTTSTPSNCGASNGTATANVQGGTGPFTYQWSSNGGNQPTAHGLLAGQYTVIVTDALGCTSTATATVGTGPLPGNINMSSTNVSCFGGNDGTATAIVNGGQGPYVYQWSNGGFTPTISNLSAGTYYLTVISNGGCISTDSVTITGPATPVSATTTQSNVTCFGGNDGSATVAPTGGTPPYTASWNTNPVQNNYTATSLASGNYIVTVTDNNGCVTSQNITISQPLPLGFNSSNIQDVSCFGGNNGSISISVGGGVTPYNYNWNNNSFPSANSINGLTAGVYLLTVTDGNGCVANSQYTVTEPTALVASVTNKSDISCHGLMDGSIQTNSVGGTSPYNYQWTQAVSTTPNATNLGFGYHVLTVIDANGCMDTTAAMINEPSPILTILQGGGDTICPGQPTALTATAIGGTGNYTYQWNNGNTGATQTVSPPSSTTYSVFATDANGCIGAPDSAIVLVNDISLVSLSTVPDTNLCEGSPYQISANISGGIGTYSFNWNNGLGQGQGPFVVAPLSSTNYTVTVTDNCGNSIHEIVTVDVNPLPIVALQPQNETACGSVSFEVSNNAQNPAGSTYFWDFGNGNNSQQPTPTVVFNQTGGYLTTLTVTSPFGCVNSGQTNLNATVHPQPVAKFDFDPRETDILNTNITFDNYSVDADFYSWNFGDGATSNQMNPVHKYQQEGSFIITLIASNAFGCKDTAIDELLIEPHFDFYIPNAFTPDNDGLNDIFTAVGEAIETFSMQIFNRWGELIYETNDLEKGWDGTAKGGSEVSMTGVYVYNIKLKDWEGVNHKFVGKVSLLK